MIGKKRVGMGIEPTTVGLKVQRSTKIDALLTEIERPYLLQLQNILIIHYRIDQVRAQV